jgi:hypothetical protein
MLCLQPFTRTVPVLRRTVVTLRPALARRPWRCASHKGTPGLTRLSGYAWIQTRQATKTCCTIPTFDIHSIRIIQTICIISKVMNDSLKVQCSGTLFRTGTKVGGRYPTTSTHFSAQQDVLPAKNMIATQARQNKRRHAFQRCPWEACNRKGKKTHVHSDRFRNTHMPSIGGTLSLKRELPHWSVYQFLNTGV